MSLNVAVLKDKETGEVGVRSVTTDSQQETMVEYDDEEVLDFVQVEGRLADALRLLCDDPDRTDTGSLSDQLDKLLTHVYEMRREPAKKLGKKKK